MRAFSKTTFVPQFFVEKNGAEAVEFYKKAFDALELRRFSNDDGTVHVSELEIGGALFHIHEEKPSARQYSPALCGGTTTIMGLMVADPDALMESNSRRGKCAFSNARLRLWLQAGGDQGSFRPSMDDRKGYLSASKAYFASFQNSSRAIILGLKNEISAGQSFLLNILTPSSA